MFASFCNRPSELHETDNWSSMVEVGLYHTSLVSSSPVYSFEDNGHI